jgi:putative DNA-binding protein
MIPFQDAAQSTSPLAATALARRNWPRPHASVKIASLRNETAIELMQTLSARFPTVVRMLGEDAFFEVAAEFVAQQAPTLLASTFYGDLLPAFLRRIGTIASASYVADVAAIDAARIASRQISEAAAAPYVRRGNLFPDSLARAALHPSAILLQSKFPAVTGWRVNQSRGDRRMRRWGPEDALVACTGLDAEVWRLPHGGFAFLSALIAGASLADAIAAASRASPSFDRTEMAAILDASNMVTAMKPAGRYRDRRAAARRARTPHARSQANVA